MSRRYCCLAGSDVLEFHWKYGMLTTVQPLASRSFLRMTVLPASRQQTSSEGGMSGPCRYTGLQRTATRLNGK